jgi:hypothetical protein
MNEARNKLLIPFLVKNGLPGPSYQFGRGKALNEILQRSQTTPLSDG